MAANFESLNAENDKVVRHIFDIGTRMNVPDEYIEIAFLVANIESSLRFDQSNPSSSAWGVFQYVDSAWETSVNRLINDQDDFESVSISIDTNPEQIRLDQEWQTVAFFNELDMYVGHFEQNVGHPATYDVDRTNILRETGIDIGGDLESYVYYRHHTYGTASERPNFHSKILDELSSENREAASNLLTAISHVDLSDIEALSEQLEENDVVGSISITEAQISVAQDSPEPGWLQKAWNWLSNFIGSIVPDVGASSATRVEFKSNEGQSFEVLIASQEDKFNIVEELEIGPSISISNASVLEGGLLEFTITLDDFPTTDVTFDVQTYLNGTFGDYNGFRVERTIPASQTNKELVVRVQTVPDSDVDSGDVMYIALENIVGARVEHPTDAWGAGTIIDDTSKHLGSNPTSDTPPENDTGDHDLPSDKGGLGDPDYELTFFTVSDNTIGFNQEFTVYYGAVNNGGDAVRNQTQTGFILSDDLRYGDGDDLYITADGLQNLSSGEHDENDFERITLSDHFSNLEIQNGDYYLFALLDYEEDEDEQDYSDNLNNPVKITITGVPGSGDPTAGNGDGSGNSSEAIDLAFENVKLSSYDFTVDDLIYLDFDVVNYGYDDDVELRVSWYVSDDPALSSDDWRWGTFRENADTSYGSSWVYENWWFNTGIDTGVAQSGTYYVIGKITNHSDELEDLPVRNNNTHVIPVEIENPYFQPGLPTLSIDIPQPGEEGSDFVWTVTARGNYHRDDFGGVKLGYSYEITDNSGAVLQSGSRSTSELRGFDNWTIEYTPHDDETPEDDTLLTLQFVEVTNYQTPPIVESVFLQDNDEALPELAFTELRVDHFTFESIGSITYDFRVENLGGGTTTPSDVAIYISSDISLDSDDELVVGNFDPVPALANGGYWNYEGTVNFDSYAAGEYSIIAKVGDKTAAVETVTVLPSTGTDPQVFAATGTKTLVTQGNLHSVMNSTSAKVVRDNDFQVFFGQYNSNYYSHHIPILEFDLTDLNTSSLGDATLTIGFGSGAKNDLLNADGAYLVLVGVETGSNGLTIDDWGKIEKTDELSNRLDSSLLSPDGTFEFELTDAGRDFVAGGGELAIVSSYFIDGATPNGPRNSAWDGIQLSISEASLEFSGEAQADGLDQEPDAPALPLTSTFTALGESTLVTQGNLNSVLNSTSALVARTGDFQLFFGQYNSSYYSHHVPIIEFDIAPSDLIEVTSGSITIDIGEYGQNDLLNSDGAYLVLVGLETGADGVTINDWSSIEQSLHLSDAINTNTLTPNGSVTFEINDLGLKHLEAGGELALVSSYYSEGLTPIGANNNSWDGVSFSVSDVTLELSRANTLETPTPEPDAVSEQLATSSFTLTTENATDVLVYQNNIYANNASYGQVNVGGWGSTSKLFIDFDLAGLPQNIDQIEGVSLRLYTEKHPTWKQDGRIEVSRLTGEWDEHLRWSSSPGEVDSFIFNNINDDGWVDIDITDYYLAWLAEPSSAHGLVLSSISTNQEANIFKTTEASDFELRPYLQIDHFEFV